MATKYNVSLHQILQEEGLAIGVFLSSDQILRLSKITTKKSLTEALSIGVELEQAVMLEYLFAGFSLRTYPQEMKVVIDQLEQPVKEEDPNVIRSKLNPQQSEGYIMEMCRQYRYILYEVAKQEMFHLARACNILVALGETPNIRTVRFPSKACGIPTNLAKFDFSSLKTFLLNEEPFEPTKSKSTRFKLRDNSEYMSISELYSNIQDGLVYLRDCNLFSHCRPELQFHYPKSQQYLIVTSHEIAENSVQIIQDEGEGSTKSLNMFQAAIDFFNVWLESKYPDISHNRDLVSIYKTMEKCLKVIREDITKSGKVQELLQNFTQLASSYSEWLKNGGPMFGADGLLDKSGIPTMFEARSNIVEGRNVDTGFTTPSHWETFFLMAYDYINASMDIPHNASKKIAQKEMLNLSRDCIDNPGVTNIKIDPNTEIPRNPITDQYAVILAELGNLGYDLMLCLLESTFIPVSDANQEKYKITKRYYYFAYFPVMTMVIRPIGEILTYFRLSQDEPNKSAGMPFEMTDSESLPTGTTLTPDMLKFVQITKKMCELYLQSKILSEVDKFNMKESIAPWMKKGCNQGRGVIQEQIMYRVERLTRAIEVMVTQYLMQIPPEFFVDNKINLIKYRIEPKVKLADIGHCLKPVIKKEDVQSKEGHYKQKLYIEIQFEGWALYAMANDPDTTDDPIGTQGRVFSYFYEKNCEKNDPFLDQYFHTQNPSENSITGEDEKWVPRDCCPPEHYEGLKITKRSVLIPVYYEHKEGTTSVSKLNEELEKCEFDKFEFLPIVQSGTRQFSNFPMLNYALTNTYVLNPANFRIFSSTTKDYYIRRADVFVDADPEEPTKTALFYDMNIYQAAALSKHGNAFESVQSLLLRHTAVSGGFKQWNHIEGVASINPGCVLNSVDINSATQVGSDWTDYYYVYKKRADKIWKEICINITHEYGNKAGDTVITQLTDLRENQEFGFEIMLYIIISQFKNNTVRSKSIILQRRLVSVTKLVSACVPGFPAPLNNQYVYNIAVNGPDKETIGKDTNDKRFQNSKLPDCFQLMKNLDWPIQFWVGAMDYDSTAFYIKGTWLIPFYPK